MSRSARRLALVLAGVVVPSVAPRGQTVSGRAVIASPTSSARFAGVTERVDGLWAGLAFEVRAGRLTLSASGMRGRMTASEPGSAPKRDVGEVSLCGRYDVRPWFSVNLRYAVRAFSSAVGYQRWDIVGVGATASRDLGTPAVRAFVGLAYLPVVKVSGQPRVTFALGSDVGISVAPNRSPITFELRYPIERFRFPAAVGRSEQFEELTLSVGVRARRLGGRWTLAGTRN